MLNQYRYKGSTLLEIGVALLLLAILLLMLLGDYTNSQRASTRWVQGQFKLAPQQIPRAPESASFVFVVTSGSGVDQNEQPVGNGVGLPGRLLSFELFGNGGDSGIIHMLNTTTVNSNVGAIATDIAGMVTITIRIDNDGPYLLKVNDPANGAEERHFFIAEP